MLESATEQKQDAKLTVWLGVFVAVGVALRLFVYGMDNPIWGDEAFVGLNIIQRTYRELLQPLDHWQVAPIGFLWIERFAYQMWGMSEYAMRLIPVLAGIAALGLFAIWARLLASPLAAALAVGVLAVGNYSVSYAVELKPYGFDLFAAMLLMLPATLFLLRHKTGWLVLLIFLTPIALAVSYPVVFTAGGIGVGLAVAIASGQMKRGEIFLLAIFAIVLLMSFWLIVWHVGAGQYQHESASMILYWKDAFPPGNPLKLAWWLARMHTGNMMAYPFGGKNGASILSFCAFSMGLWIWLKGRRGPILWMMLTPFALNFLAAALRKYPYGESARVCQPLAAVVILMIGQGVARLVERFASTARNRQRASRVLFVLLLGFGVGVGVNEWLHPYYLPGYVTARRTMRDFFQQAGNDATIAVMQKPAGMDCTFQWYLLEHKGHLLWNPADVAASRGNRPVWLVAATTRPSDALEATVPAGLLSKAAIHQTRTIQLDAHPAPPIDWEAFFFPGGIEAEKR